MTTISANTKISKPKWLKVKLPGGKEYASVKKIINKHKLHTICESGNCPNIGECLGAGTATFMILGNICSRSCHFCAVKTGSPKPVDTNEPDNIARAVRLMKLKHCVITSVSRDDLEDYGSGIWAKTVIAIRKENPGTTIETLIPDFQANKEDIQRIIDVKPEIISHNLETVRRLTKHIRVQAKYERSLKVLKILSALGGKEANMTTKSGFMVGLGETEEEIFETMDDLINAECDIITIGQYLQPTLKHFPVQRYITPEEFNKYKEIGIKKGFKYVESAPLVRSSYHAEKHLLLN